MTTSINKQISDGSPDGTTMGQSATDIIGFYGATPVAQRSAVTQLAASVVSVSSNITIAASLTAWLVEVTATLKGLGIIPNN
jgi:hypothetical protein